MLCQRWYLQPFIALGHAAVAEATFHIRSESSGQIAGENTVALTAAERAPDALPAVVSATIYRSRTCGCCGSYISYLRRAGVKVEEKVTTDAEMVAVKKQFGVPEEEASCHTARIDNYTVEGHVPLEAIQKLVAERPANIAGIALPGMPLGSPGMPGAKDGDFAISSFGA